VTYFVFAVFSEPKAALVSLWIRSWEARGWKARILSAREIQEAGSARQAIIRRRCRYASLLVDLQTINFSQPPKAGLKLRATRFGKWGWKTAGLVRFSSVGEVYACGRPLCL
jgi:hypothetical protein